MDVKKQNFERIAENRTSKIVELISKLHNLTNPSFYDYTDEQVEKMFQSIQDELDKQKEEFRKAKNSKKRIKL